MIDSSDLVLLTREQRDKRVAVMRDVIERLDGPNPPKVVFDNGYFSAEIDAPQESDAGADLGAVLPRLRWARWCGVCALGALLISKAALYDGVPLQLDRGGDVHYGFLVTRSHLEDVFDHDTLDSIEAAFEITGNGAAARFGIRYTTAVDRLRAIAQNVIDHDGKLVLSVEA